MSRPPMTSFAVILRDAVDAVPGAIGGAFADSGGEIVDSYSVEGGFGTFELAILTAHYGVLWRHIKSAFGALHFGGPTHAVMSHPHLDIVVALVAGGYYTIVAAQPPVPIGKAFGTLDRAAVRLRKEMG